MTGYREVSDGNHDSVTTNPALHNGKAGFFHEKTNSSRHLKNKIT